MIEDEEDDPITEELWNALTNVDVGEQQRLAMREDKIIFSRCL
jgi:hypothetical protein